MKNDESDLFTKCSKCHHQKADHEFAAKTDKRKCLISACKCDSFLPDRKYYKK